MSNASAPHLSSSRSSTTLLGLLMLVSFAICVWYGFFEPHSERFYDERYCLENVRSILEEGSLRPVSGYYQFITYLPQSLVLLVVERFTNESRVFTEDGRFSPLSYYICRAIQAVYGTACLYVVFLLGRRIFGPHVALIGCLLMAAAPWHVHAAAEFKPDSLLVLTTLLAMYWSLLAVERQTRRSYALAGLGIALAMSSKFPGGIVALPLCLGTLLWSWRQPRVWLQLTLAGVVSVIGFVVFNPYFHINFHFLGVLHRDYVTKASGTKLDGFIGAVSLPFLDTIHGPVFGGLAYLGLLVLLADTLRGDLTQTERRARWMFLSFAPLYTIIYTLITPHFKVNNFLVVLPYSSLAAAWAIALIWRRLRSSIVVLRRRWLHAPVAVAFSVVAIWPAVAYTYNSVIPTTLDIARRSLWHHLGTHERRFIYEETWLQPLPHYEADLAPGTEWTAWADVPSLTTLTSQELNAADGLIFLESRLTQTGADFYQTLMRHVPESAVTHVERKLLRVRGPRMVAIAHPWQPPGEEAQIKPDITAQPPLNYVVSIPERYKAGQIVSIALWVPYLPEKEHSAPQLFVGASSAIPLYPTRGMLSGHLYTTGRFVLAEVSSLLKLTPHPGTHRDSKFAAEVWPWSGWESESRTGVNHKTDDEAPHY